VYYPGQPWQKKEEVFSFPVKGKEALHDEEATRKNACLPYLSNE